MNTPIIRFCVASFRFAWAARSAFLVFALIGFAIFAPVAFAQPDPSIFDQRRFVPPPNAPAPEAARPPAPARAIPRVVLIAGAAVLLIVSSFLLFKSARAWRSSNLFDRQYRFPAAGPPALRFGGNRCGGQMAAIKFSDASEAKAFAKSDRKNA